MPRHKSICQICGCADGFAALDRSGSVVAWGALPLVPHLRDVQRLSATSRAFAALKKDGTVYTWGDRQSRKLNRTPTGPNSNFFPSHFLVGGVFCFCRSTGGDSQRVESALVNVQQICGSSLAFSAVLGDRTVISWGDKAKGGDSSQVQERLKDVVELFA